MRKNRVFIIATWLAILLVGGLLISTTKFTANLSEFLPRSPTTQQAILNEQLRQGILSRQIMISIDGGDAAIRAKLSNELVRKLQGNTAFLSINNGSSNGDTRIFHYIFSHRYLLSPTVNPTLFTVAGLHNAIADSIDMLATPGGEMVQSLLPSDPTGATVQMIQSMGSGARPVTRDGVWSSRSGKSALILAQTRASGSAMNAQQAAINDIQTAFAVAKSEAGSVAANTTLMMTGVGVISVASRDAIVHAAEWMSTISITLIIILLLLVYRSGIVLILGLIPVFSGVIVGISAVALGFSVVYDITLGFGTALIGEAVDYSIYFFVQSGQSATGSEEWIRNYWPTIRLGVLTSIIGFASLLFSNLPGLAQLGLYAIAGLLTAAIVTRLVLPTLLPGNFKSRDLSSIGEHLLRLTRTLSALRPGVVLLLIAASAVLVSHRDKIWNYDLSALSPVPAAAQRLYTQMRTDLGVSESGYLVVVSAPTVNATLAVAEKTGNALQGLVEDHVIAGYESPARYLPSVTLQQERQAAIPPKDVLEMRLHEALLGLPVKASLFTPFIKESEAQRTLTPLTLADLRGTSIEMVVNSMLIRHGNGWDAILPLKAPASGIVDAQRVRASLARHHIPGAMLIDLSGTSNQLYKSYLINGIKLSLSGVAFIALLLLFVLRSPVRVIRILLPLIAAVLTVSAGLVLLGYELNIMNLIGLMLIVAVGSNYALFFDQGDRQVHGEIAPRTLASLVIANITTIMGFGPLAFSGVPVLQAIGAAVAPGVVLALLFSASFSQHTTV
ncbi:MAG: MMPL family transporter [Acidithiobacillus ferrooxidans]|nr:MMPL family transporter [Acidithiobacillus ferrooxidans]MDD5002939.1 MMPL family transporter [Acidithiobacillus sp.]MDD5377906.1 MMPL family transporter [Acidithiobacillus sp.]MDD5577220.1 MMPL family transporter [Acidithiobacillus sp.]